MELFFGIGSFMYFFPHVRVLNIKLNEDVDQKNVKFLSWG